jgi:hypothetical protein
MSLSQRTVYAALMSRLVCLAIAIVLSLLSVAAPAAPIHKRPAPHWRGYGFLPGYQQPLSNSVPLYAQKAAALRMARRDRRPGILTRSLVITGMMATGTISAGPALTAAATMAAALVRAGLARLSARSGIAADRHILSKSVDP